MPGRLQKGPLREEVERLRSLLETAENGSVALDAEVARTFFRQRDLVTKNGELFWYSRNAEGPSFECVPHYTRRIDATLPGERASRVEITGEFKTRWLAHAGQGFEADGATEPLARRLLALKLVASAKRKPPRIRHNLAKQRTTENGANEPAHSKVEIHDHRDLIILEMTAAINRLTMQSRQTVGEISDHEYFEIKTPRKVVGGPTSPRQIADDIPVISELAEEWISDKNPSELVRFLLRKIIRRYIEVSGDLPVNEIKKLHVRNFLVRLRDCPKSLPQRLKGRSLETAIAYGKLHPEVPKLAVSTINAHCTYLRLIFNWAFLRDYVQYNAAAGLHVKDTRPRAAKRLPYNIDDLKMLFEKSPLYTGHMPVIRTRSGPHIYRDARFWLPLIALFTGARLGELMNLSPDDLRRENQIDYFDITKGATLKRVKSRASERRIPVHPELIRIGIVEFFEQKRIDQAQYVFAELGRETDDGLKAICWHDKWRRLNRRAGCEHPKKTFHSLRHSFKDACRAAKVPEEAHDALTGHMTSSVGRRYGSGFPLNVLSEYVTQLRYPGLDLSHLYRERSDSV
jgi:integrase